MVKGVNPCKIFEAIQIYDICTYFELFKLEIIFERG
jgi:hypothetical protein